MSEAVISPAAATGSAEGRRSGIIIINGRAGTLAQTGGEELVRRAGIENLEIFDVQDGNTTRAIGDAVRNGVRTVIVAGGDGSVHHAMQALVGTEAVLGIVPLGTFNHLAHDLGLPTTDPAEALDVALRGLVAMIDTGVANGRYFANNMVLGIYPLIARVREEQRGKGGKWGAYLSAARMALGHFPDVPLLVQTDDDSDRYRTQMFAVSVDTYDLEEGGLLSTRERFDEGLLTTYALPHMSRPAFALSTARYVLGRIRETDGFQMRSSRSVRIESTRKVLQVVVDGEVWEVRPPIDVEVVPASLRVRVPHAKPE